MPATAESTSEGWLGRTSGLSAHPSLSSNTIQQRLQRGWPVAVALATPLTCRLAPTPLSAALLLAQWTDAHQRPPKWREYSAGEGLYAARSYLQWFQASTLAAMLVQASATLACRVTTKPCLNAPACPEMILDEGAHIRFCTKCRGRACARDDAYREPAFPRTRLERWGVGGDTWGLREDIDWNGGQE
jgi:hypothetical protein